MSLTKVRNVLDVTADTMADLLSMKHKKGSVQLLGFHEKGDEGGGVFYWDADESTETHNGGTIIAGNKDVGEATWGAGGATTWFDTPAVATGCWKREFSGAVNVKWFGAKGDGVADDTDAIQAAIDLLLVQSGGVVALHNGTYRTSAPLELSSNSIEARRKSVALHGPACIKPLNTFSGNQVIQHTQLTTQATGLSNSWSFGYGANLFDIEIDGSDISVGSVHGIRFDGAWQPTWRNVHVHDMTGNGWHVPADNSISATGDDEYANITPILFNCKFTGNGGWGIFLSRFGAGFYAIGVYVNNNISGGVRITAPNVTWLGGAIGYNGGVGLHFARSESAIQSQLSNCTFMSTEFDRNAVNNIWFEHAYNCSIERPRLITGETGPNFSGGSYTSATMVRFGGTLGQSSFNNRIVQPYVRDSQQTTNPALTLYDFTAQSQDCEVIRQHRLTGGTSNVVIGTASGIRNSVTNSAGEYVFSSGLSLRTGYCAATLTAATSISTALVDIVFNSESTDLLNRYDPSTGIYSFGNDTGLFAVKGFLTVDAAAATTNRVISIHFRYDPGTGSFASDKFCTVQINGSSQAQLIPFDFTLAVTSQNARVKLAAVASTGTALLVGNQSTSLEIYKI